MTRKLSFRPTLEALEDRSVPAIVFKFDYSYDTNGFFNDSGRRAALETAGKMLGSRLNDNLAAIPASTSSNRWTAGFQHPGTGMAVNRSNLSVPTNTIVVFAGGRDLSGDLLAWATFGSSQSYGTSAWNTLVSTRGQTGTPNRMDVSPWGGSISFDTLARWHFGLTTSGLDSNETDFVSVAVHELGHILGITDANASWNRLVTLGGFYGISAVPLNGYLAVPVNPRGDHFAEGTLSDGLEAAMDPSHSPGVRKLFSRLDFAALQDIGWQVSTINDTVYHAQHVLTGEKPDPLFGGGARKRFYGAIDTMNDVDMYRVYVHAGSSLTFSVSKYNNRPLDTYLKLLDGAGNVLTTADQAAWGTDTLRYKATRSDYYYLAVSSYGNRNFNPFAVNSGYGGMTGDYLAVLEVTW